MATEAQIIKLLNGLGKFLGCPSCGVRIRFGDQECPRCGDDLYDDLSAWAKDLIDEISGQNE